MPLFQLAILALIQGVTEFLPISSSAHLILAPKLLGVADQGLTIDVAVHMGTLVAVCIYFHRDLRDATLGCWHVLTGRLRTPQARLALLLALATVPVLCVGLVLDLFGLLDEMRSITLIGWTTLLYGIPLYIADRWGPQSERTEGWTARDALLMGFAQMLALVPGTSRSGVTMTAARFLGYTRVDAARLSLLMSIPTIMAAGGLKTIELAQTADATLSADAATAAALSCVAALVVLSLMMRMLRTWTMTPFVLYRLALGAFLLWIAYA